MSNSDSDDNWIQCLLCKQFHQKSNIEDHIIKSHICQITLVAGGIINNRYKCFECKKYFKKYELNHICDHENYLESNEILDKNKKKMDDKKDTISAKVIRPRGRPKRNSVTQANISNFATPNHNNGGTPIHFASNNTDSKIKRGRGRPRKIKTEPAEVQGDPLQMASSVMDHPVVPDQKISIEQVPFENNQQSLAKKGSIDCYLDGCELSFNSQELLERHQIFS